MALQEEFEKAAAEARQLTERPSNETLLKLYSLYKQGMEGDVSGEVPSMADFVARAKYNAWEQLKGMSRQEAQQKYVDQVNELKGM